MRMTAPVIGSATIALAVALVWYFRPAPEVSDVPAAAEPPVPVEQGTDAAAPIADGSTTASTAAPPAAPGLARSPLPGETPATPMAQMLADRQQNMIVRDDPGGGVPPGLAEGEREFAAEPVDATWAPGAEADLLAKFAQMPGLKLIDLQVECRSTMCRLQLTQPSGVPEQGGALPFNILRDGIGLTPRWMMAVVDGLGAPPGPMKSIAYLWRDGFAPERATGAPHDAN